MSEKKSESKPNQSLPKGHFNSDGQSQGKSTGVVRPQCDAYNTRTESRKK